MAEKSTGSVSAGFGGGERPDTSDMIVVHKALRGASARDLLACVASSRMTRHVERSSWTTTTTSCGSSTCTTTGRRSSCSHVCASAVPSHWPSSTPWSPSIMRWSSCWRTRCEPVRVGRRRHRGPGHLGRSAPGASRRHRCPPRPRGSATAPPLWRLSHDGRVGSAPGPCAEPVSRGQGLAGARPDHGAADTRRAGAHAGDDAAAGDSDVERDGVGRVRGAGGDGGLSRQGPVEHSSKRSVLHRRRPYGAMRWSRRHVSTLKRRCSFCSFGPK